MPLLIVLALFSSMPSFWKLVPISASWGTFILCYLIVVMFLFCVIAIVRAVAQMTLLAKQRVIGLIRRNTPYTLSHGKLLGATQYYNILIHR
jgi:hypothetical protein